MLGLSINQTINQSVIYFRHKHRTMCNKNRNRGKYYTRKSVHKTRRNLLWL